MENWFRESWKHKDSQWIMVLDHWLLSLLLWYLNVSSRATSCLYYLKLIQIQRILCYYYSTTQSLLEALLVFHYCYGQYIQKHFEIDENAKTDEVLGTIYLGNAVKIGYKVEIREKTDFINNAKPLQKVQQENK